MLKDRIEALSFSVLPNAIEAKWKDLDSLTNLTFPKSKVEMLSFLGSLQYYRRFIQQLSGLSACLYNMSDEKTDLSVEKAAFEQLQQLIRHLPRLAQPDPSQPFDLLIYANAYSIGSCLAQFQANNKLQVIGFDARVFVLKCLIIIY